jgi:chlorite dismutase
MTADAYYSYYPVFRRTAEIPEGTADEIERLFEKYADRVTVRGTYLCTGFRPDTDLMFFLVTESAEDAQEFVVEFRRTELGKNLELTHAFLGVVRPAEFNPDHLPSFLKEDKPPKKYLSVYPFVRTEEWYLMPPADRGKLLAEHGKMGREFPDVLPNTTSAFGLGDWEWILAFEADDPTHLVDCIRRLREAEARRYTKLDIPFVVGIRRELREVLERLS